MFLKISPQKAELFMVLEGEFFSGFRRGLSFDGFRERILWVCEDLAWDAGLLLFWCFCGEILEKEVRIELTFRERKSSFLNGLEPGNGGFLFIYFPFRGGKILEYI